MGLDTNAPTRRPARNPAGRQPECGLHHITAGHPQHPDHLDLGMTFVPDVMMGWVGHAARCLYGAGSFPCGLPGSYITSGMNGGTETETMSGNDTASVAAVLFPDVRVADLMHQVSTGYLARRGTRSRHQMWGSNRSMRSGRVGADRYPTQTPPQWGSPTSVRSLPLGT